MVGTAIGKIFDRIRKGEGRDGLPWNVITRFSLSMETECRLMRMGRARLHYRDQILRRKRGQGGEIRFCCRILGWTPSSVDAQSADSDDSHVHAQAHTRACTYT